MITLRRFNFATLRPMIRRWVCEPFVHFVVLGALIFAGYSLMDRRDEPEAGRIVVTQGKIENLQVSFSRMWRRPPTPAELDGLIQDYIREEVFVREGIGLGLDRDDTIIRRRLRQKMEFVGNDLASQAEPDEKELEEFLVKHPDLFRTEPRFTFRQVYLSPDRRGARLKEDAARLLAELNRAGAKEEFHELGDSTLLSAGLTDAQASEVTRQFGEEFARQLAEIPTGRWEGPVTSGYGLHLVYVDDRVNGRMPELADIREQVLREWSDAHRQKGNEQFYQGLLKRYAVTVEQSEISNDKSQEPMARSKSPNDKSQTAKWLGEGRGQE